MALRKALPLKSSAAIKELVDMFGAPDEASPLFEYHPYLRPYSLIEHQDYLPSNVTLF